MNGGNNRNIELRTMTNCALSTISTMSPKRSRFINCTLALNGVAPSG